MPHFKCWLLPIKWDASQTIMGRYLVKKNSVIRRPLAAGFCVRDNVVFCDRRQC